MVECKKALSFLKKVLRFIRKSDFHKEVKFSKSVELVFQFLSHQFNQMDFLKSILGKLKSIGSKMDYKQQNRTEQNRCNRTEIAS